MRVCFVTASASRLAFGVLPAMTGAALALRDLGHHVHVVTARDRYIDQDRSLWAETPVTEFRRVGPRLLHYTPGLYRWLTRQDRFDVLVLHGIWMSMHAHALRYAVEKQVPVLLAPHGMLSRWALGRSRWKKALARYWYANRLLQSASCFWSISVGEAQGIEELRYPAPTALIPTGIHLPEPMDLAPERPLGGRRLLFLGRLHPVKGIDLLLDAWKKVSGSAQDWRLVVVGPDELGVLDKLKGRVADCNVDFLGPLYGEAKLQELRRADALILPSLSEGLPVTVLEAWAFGLPVLMTPHCNLNVGFAKGAALSIEPNVDSIAHGLLTLFRMSADELKRMGQQGRSLAEEDYSWRRVGEQLDAVIQWLSGGGAPPACVRVQGIQSRPT